MKTTIILAFLTSLAAAYSATSIEVTVDGSKPRVPLSPHLYGLFFEDINYAADGGLYAELVQNRSFEYDSVNGNDSSGQAFHPLFAWDVVERGGAECELEVGDAKPLNEKNKNYLEIHVQQAGTGGVRNLGFDGIRIDSGASYNLSLHSRATNWEGPATIDVALELPDGSVCGTVRLEGVGAEWKKHEATITSNTTSNVARLVVTTAGEGVLHLDMISLFPEDTWKGRRNGLRKDLVQALVDLNPKFLRFPGGCIAHGQGIDNVYNWKDTVGNIEERKPNWNLWGYHQTYGLGYFEYFLLCEDLGAHPLPVVPLGVSCGFRSPFEHVHMDEMGTCVQDALDLIEFANGPADSTWGAVRASMGHPEPFGMEFICLGNEPHDNSLIRERFPLFVNAIREKYPDLKIIGTSGLGWQIPIYDLMTDMKVYSSDEHYYEDPAWYLDNVKRFDTFDRNKPKIFVGEYASKGSTLFNALSEAAYLTGIERNGDIVDMTCYAPLFGNIHHCQWNPNLIYFDQRTVVRTPNYHVQQLFASNKGDEYVPTTLKKTIEDDVPVITGSVGIGSWLTAIEVESLKVNGKKLDPSKWRVHEGNFHTINGHYSQVDVEVEGALSMSPETFKDANLTYEVRARKLGGSEGFLVTFGGSDRDNTYWWNVGGWQNTMHGLELIDAGSSRQLDQVNGSIENNRWYDLKVELTPAHIRCYIDGKQVHSISLCLPSLSASSGFDKKAGELIIKLVNPTDSPESARIRLKELGQIHKQADLTVLTGAGGATNTVLHPDQVRPEHKVIETSDDFDLVVPATSLQVLRIKTN